MSTRKQAPCDVEVEEAKSLSKVTATNRKRRCLPPCLSNCKLREDCDERVIKGQAIVEDSDNPSSGSSDRAQKIGKRSRLQDDYFHINPKVARHLFEDMRTQSQQSMSCFQRLLQDAKNDDMHQTQQRKLLLGYQNHTEKLISLTRNRLSSAEYFLATASQYIPLTPTCCCSQDKPANHFAVEESCLAHNQDKLLEVRIQINHLERQLQKVRCDLGNLKRKKQLLEEEFSGQGYAHLYPVLREELQESSSDDCHRSMLDSTASGCRTVPISTFAIERAPMSYMTQLLNGIQTPYDHSLNR